MQGLSWFALCWHVGFRVPDRHHFIPRAGYRARCFYEWKMFLWSPSVSWLSEPNLMETLPAVAEIFKPAGKSLTDTTLPFSIWLKSGSLSSLFDFWMYIYWLLHIIFYSMCESGKLQNRPGFFTSNDFSQISILLFRADGRKSHWLRPKPLCKDIYIYFFFFVIIAWDFRWRAGKRRATFDFWDGEHHLTAVSSHRRPEDKRRQHLTAG